MKCNHLFQKDNEWKSFSYEWKDGTGRDGAMYRQRCHYLPRPISPTPTPPALKMTGHKMLAIRLLAIYLKTICKQHSRLPGALYTPKYKADKWTST